MPVVEIRAYNVIPPVGYCCVPLPGSGDRVSAAYKNWWKIFESKQKQAHHLQVSLATVFVGVEKAKAPDSVWKSSLSDEEHLCYGHLVARRVAFSAIPVPGQNWPKAGDLWSDEGRRYCGKPESIQCSFGRNRRFRLCLSSGCGKRGPRKKEERAEEEVTH